MYNNDISNKKERFFYNIGLFIGSNYKDAVPLERIYNIFAGYGKNIEYKAFLIFKSEKTDAEKVENLIDLMEMI